MTDEYMHTTPGTQMQWTVEPRKRPCWRCRWLPFLRKHWQCRKPYPLPPHIEFGE